MTDDKSEEKDSQLEKYAKRYSVYPMFDESDEQFRVRVAMVALEETGDTLLSAEILTGNYDYHNFNKKENGLALALQIMNVDRKETEALLSGDTYMSMPWVYFDALVEQNGFKEVLAYNFKTEQGNETYKCWIRKDLGLLLTGESFTLINKSINSTNLYFEMNLPDDFNFYDLSIAMKSSSSSPRVKGEYQPTFLLDFDGREGLVKYIKELESLPSEVKLNSPWKFLDKRFLWLLDYSEENKKVYDHTKISYDKIKSMTVEAQEMLGFKK
ncbi:MAG: hypothetical protein ABIB43_00510 [archaeon]